MQCCGKCSCVRGFLHKLDVPLPPHAMDNDLCSSSPICFGNCSTDSNWAQSHPSWLFHGLLPPSMVLRTQNQGTQGKMKGDPGDTFWCSQLQLNFLHHPVVGHGWIALPWVEIIKVSLLIFYNFPHAHTSVSGCRIFVFPAYKPHVTGSCSYVLPSPATSVQT